ncbi:hypothetical protein HDU97_000060 [Phlyctochytrium planicorne]|nr:hypothetical protein HDU97_000060 [Phlyctochytrium planicorne]
MQVIPQQSRSGAKGFNEPFKTRLSHISTLISKGGGGGSSRHDLPESTINDVPLELSFESLLDSFIALVMDCKAASNQNEHVSGFLGKYDKFAIRLQSLRVNTQDFEIVKTLATGAVGKVCLVIGRIDKQVYAMKVLKKTDLLTRREAAFFMEERNALVFARESVWITTLYAAFQDEENLYLVMEYASGGSLRSLMNNRESPMAEQEARFYIAELLLALEELHSLHYIHRDVKPENCLIEASGHLKLADFGSCIRIGDSNKVTSHETVGTPDYISPEILRAHEGNVFYGTEVDMWSVGIILYELLFDEVPFYSESLMETYGKIMDHEKHFSFPNDISISKEAEDLIKRLVCKQESRLGKSGIHEIKSHPWFKDFDWKSARERKPPFVPELSGPDDTRYFDDEENESKKVIRKNLPRTKEFAGQNLPFIGYTYIQNALASVIWPFEESIKLVGSSQEAIADSAVAIAATGHDELRKLEEAMASLEAARVKDSQYRDELQGLVSRLERDRNRLEADLSKSRADSAENQRDKDELESRLNALRRRLDSENQVSKARIQVLTEERDAVIGELSALKAEFKHHKETEMSREEREKSRDGEREDMQRMIDRLNARLTEYKMQRDEAVMKSDDLNRKLERESRKREELDQEYQQLLQKNDGLEIDLKTAKKSLSNELAKVEKLTMSNIELERTKTMLTVDMLSAKRKIETLEEEKSVVEKTFNEKLKSRGEAQEDIDHLRTQVEMLSKQRKEDSETLSALQIEKASFEHDLAKSSELLMIEREHASESSKKLLETQEKLKQLSERITFLEETRSKMANVHNAAEKEYEESKAALLLQIQSLKDVQIRIHSIEREKLAQGIELDETKSRLATEASLRKEYLRQISETEKSLAEEKRLRENVESERNRLETSISELRSELEAYNLRLSSQRDDHNRLLSEKETAFATLKEEYLALSLKQETESRGRSQTESDLASHLKLLKDMTERQAQDSKKIYSLEKTIESLEAELREVSTHRSLEAVRAISLQDRIDELENATGALREQLDDAKSRLSKSLDSLKADNKSVHSETHSDKGRNKLRNVFFRSQQQKAEQERAMQRIHEVEEDLKKDQLERRRSRHISNDSNTSFRSNLTRMSDPALNIEFDFSGGLKGWLKVPKGGKVKKGWRIRFAIVREHKLYMFDKDKDYEITDSAIMADLRADLFLARSVNQNELIHASAKDIDCIFKIQFTQSNKSLSSPTGAISTAEITRKILKLKADIQHEEKMHVAAERILNVTTEAQKPSVLAQLDVANKRIAKMKSELQSLNDQLNSKNGIADEGMGTSSPTNLDEISAEVFEEEVQFCKRELESQLDDEVRKYNNLLKLVGPSHSMRGQIKGAVPIQTNFKEIESEIQSTESMLHKIKEDLAFVAYATATQTAMLSKYGSSKNQQIVPIAMSLSGVIVVLSAQTAK